MVRVGHYAHHHCHEMASILVEDDDVATNGKTNREMLYIQRNLYRVILVLVLRIIH